VFVSSFGLLVRHTRDLSKSTSQIFMTFGTDVQYLRRMLRLTFERSEVKVKVQGQNRHSENLSLAIARLWLKKFSFILSYRIISRADEAALKKLGF